MLYYLMILLVKYFFDNDKETYYNYNKILEDNNDKIIMFNSLASLVRDLSINNNKSILGLRFPSFVKCKNILTEQLR